ncbi:hypothetical protein GLW08_03300 [Pontibacillus yanchengensis]|uniref:DUF2768 family protein n=2 Tax=Pontibacillus yanchengensis TaxID=462910 RepID=A0A6I5A4S5_9BACI|nr:hypothetical protein [Pontibacillus yanchengensis]MYL35331.1 hypothetical protein [Pontibacillus yanchengensis]MYL52360.1 hypothetical protein [Pontibacillus yanchengensis]
MLWNAIVLLIGMVMVTIGFLLRFKILTLNRLNDNQDEIIARVGGMVLIVVGTIVLIIPLLIGGEM